MRAEHSCGSRVAVSRHSRECLLQDEYKASAYRLAPRTGQPRLLIAWQARRTVEVAQFDESGCAYEVALGLPIVEGAIAVAIPTLLPLASRIGGEERASRL